MNTYNYIFIQDNFLNDMECNKLIDYYHKNKNKTVDRNNYISCDIKPKNSFDHWHSEHSVNSPLRILALQIYLSSHKCGTKFYRYKTIKSEKGRLAIWPAYFTHTHKGQVCPDNLNRFILSGYYRFKNEYI